MESILASTVRRAETLAFLSSIPVDCIIFLAVNRPREEKAQQAQMQKEAEEKVQKEITEKYKDVLPELKKFVEGLPGVDHIELDQIAKKMKRTKEEWQNRLKLWPETDREITVYVAGEGVKTKTIKEPTIPERRKLSELTGHDLKHRLIPATERYVAELTEAKNEWERQIKEYPEAYKPESESIATHKGEPTAWKPPETEEQTQEMMQEFIPYAQARVAELDVLLDGARNNLKDFEDALLGRRTEDVDQPYVQSPIDPAGMQEEYEGKLKGLYEQWISTAFEKQLAMEKKREQLMNPTYKDLDRQKSPDYSSEVALEEKFGKKKAEQITAIRKEIADLTDKLEKESAEQSPDMQKVNDLSGRINNKKEELKKLLGTPGETAIPADTMQEINMYYGNWYKKDKGDLLNEEISKLPEIREKLGDDIANKYEALIKQIKEYAEDADDIFSHRRMFVENYIKGPSEFLDLQREIRAKMAPPPKPVNISVPEEWLNVAKVINQTDEEYRTKLVRSLLGKDLPRNELWADYIVDDLIKADVTPQEVADYINATLSLHVQFQKSKAKEAPAILQKVEQKQIDDDLRYQWRNIGEQVRRFTKGEMEQIYKAFGGDPTKKATPLTTESLIQFLKGKTGYNFVTVQNWLNKRRASVIDNIIATVRSALSRVQAKAPVYKVGQTVYLKNKPTYAPDPKGDWINPKEKEKLVNSWKGIRGTVIKTEEPEPDMACIYVIEVDGNPEYVKDATTKWAVQEDQITNENPHPVAKEQNPKFKVGDMVEFNFPPETDLFPLNRAAVAEVKVIRHNEKGEPIYALTIWKIGEDGNVQEGTATSGSAPESYLLPAGVTAKFKVGDKVLVEMSDVSLGSFGEVTGEVKKVYIYPGIGTSYDVSVNVAGTAITRKFDEQDLKQAPAEAPKEEAKPATETPKPAPVPPPDVVRHEYGGKAETGAMKNEASRKDSVNQYVRLY